MGHLVSPQSCHNCPETGRSAYTEKGKGSRETRCQAVGAEDRGGATSHTMHSREGKGRRVLS